DRDELRRGLAREGIFAPIHWELPGAVTVREHPREHAIAASIVSLPCDQRYDAADMERVAASVRARTVTVT
ncbi:MAG TPA: hypothetical protein VFO60_04840, partial [Candidatus Dormibacteraeota bacterium]|nr:hypothetical protein [Candidatus Dormibacteraeota bacterium]